MNKWMIGLMAVTVAATVAVSLAIQQRARAEERSRKATFEQQADQMARLSIENTRLSNIVAQLNGSQPLSKEQLKELLGLRREAGTLREAGAEKERLKTANRRIQGAMAQSEKQLAEARSLPNFWARDQLGFAGYADPESAVRSMLWCMSVGDVAVWQSLFTPEAWAKMESEYSEHGRSEAQRIADLRSMAHELISPSVGFHVVDRQMTSTNEAIVNLSFDGEGRTRKFVLRKIGNEWKFHNLVFAGLD